MNVFKNIFGVEPGLIKEKCVLVPCLNKELLTGFGVKEPVRGKIYGCAQGKNFTLIHARIGACFIGDLVLYLKETSCCEVYLFGSCGSTGELGIGRLVMPMKCFARESFSALLDEMDKGPWPVFYPDHDLCEGFQKSLDSHGVDKRSCMTLASLKLEEGLTQYFKDLDVDVVDMECSAFFAASSKIGLKALALFYVSDIIHQKPFYAELNESDQQAAKAGMKDGIKFLCDFLQKNSNG
ncbi:MAG: hypothetical protein ABIC68_02580 [Candidatus Omnitrophota bacterium]